jgi:hypothetical protein
MLSAFWGVAGLWRPPRTPSLREGVGADVEDPGRGAGGVGDEEG